MNHWIGPNNPNIYDFRGSLEKFNSLVDWTKKRNIAVDDIFYIYESSPVQRIVAKMLVVNNKISEQERFKDEEFWFCEKKVNTKGYFRMKLIEYCDEEMTFEWIKENSGKNGSIQNQQKINSRLLRSILEKEKKGNIMNFPSLDKSERKDEFKKYNKIQVSRVVYSYLKENKSYRDIDREELGLDEKKSKGYQSFGILRYLGLSKVHKGYFKNVDSEDVEYILDEVDLKEILIYYQFALAYNEEEVTNYTENDDLKTIILDKEGRKIKYYTEKYERKQSLRKAAIKIHGVICKVCGFDFFYRYGEIGEGFIEIHHLKPLSSLSEEVEVNPRLDLVPLCSNCHRMIHRKNNLLSIEKLKTILKRQEEKNIDRVGI